jgi:hypothetical protein
MARDGIHKSFHETAMRKRISSTPEAGNAQQLRMPEQVLSALEPVLRPIIRLLISQGIDFIKFTRFIKPLFLEQAEASLRHDWQRVTDSAVSLLSGVHRKDVRTWREQGLAGRLANTVSLTNQVFTAWTDEPAYCDHHGVPRLLRRIGPYPSFETLVRSQSRDVHPYSVLSDLLRLDLARLELVDGEEYVALNRNLFMPASGSLEQLQVYSGNLADHIATATDNLIGGKPRRLEHSVFGDGLSAESVERLGSMARTLWEQAQTQIIALARRLYETDKEGGHRHRMRFGVYYHTTEDAPESDAGREN